MLLFNMFIKSSNALPRELIIKMVSICFWLEAGRPNVQHTSQKLLTTITGKRSSTSMLFSTNQS